ncbi:hypothetical protein [Roseateles noduli]|uniref:hypothetical protein n=1 Tax=Roseateles noduli TaxID=2052484 RepID=UPI003D655748
MRSILASLLLVAGPLLANPAHATAQIPEEIVLDGRVEQLLTEPLNVILREDKNLDRLRPYVSEDVCSGAWRGYRGTWAIDDGKLFLTALVTDPCSDKPRSVPLDVLFPLTVTRIPATWYSGSLVVPRGRMIEYVHMGYKSRYERYLLITIMKGVVTGQREVSDLP